MDQAELHRQAVGIVQQSGREAESGQLMINQPERSDDKGGCHESAYRTKVLHQLGPAHQYGKCHGKSPENSGDDSGMIHTEHLIIGL